MNSLIKLAFVLMVAGLMILLNVSPVEIYNHLKSYRPKKSRVSIRQKVLNITQKKKARGIKRLLSETKEILIMSGRENSFYTIVVLSLVLSVLGMSLALLMGNKLIIPILGVGFALMPFWYVKLISTKWKNELNGELETVLSVITTSYMRCDSIINAIEENIYYMNPPVYDVFNAFLADTKLINANINMALEKLREKIDSDVYREWIDAIMDCQEDKNLKSTLTPIVSKLSDMRIVSAELDNLLYEPVKEFIMMVILLLGNTPLIYFLNRDWYHTLMHTSIGKGTLAICTIVLFISISGVVKLSKPVEYRR